LVQAFLKKWWVESDFKAPNLPPLSLSSSLLGWKGRRAKTLIKEISNVGRCVKFLIFLVGIGPKKMEVVAKIS
jgi:hypothetical protein